MLKGGDTLGILIIQTYVIKPEKQEEYLSLLKRFRNYMKENPEEVKELKSWKVFAQMFGGASWGGYGELLEFNSLADFEKYVERAKKDEEHMKIYQGFMQVIVPATFSMNVWNTII